MELIQSMNRRSPDERQPPPQSLRERFRETTLQAVLTAAEDVFADAGLHAGHMGEIAERAGVAVGTLYNHFADREALLAGLSDARYAEMLAAGGRRAEGQPRAPLPRAPARHGGGDAQLLGASQKVRADRPAERDRTVPADLPHPLRAHANEDERDVHTDREAHQPGGAREGAPLRPRRPGAVLPDGDDALAAHPRRGPRGRRRPHGRGRSPAERLPGRRWGWPS